MFRKTRIRFQSLAGRISGFSTPFFGVSWTQPTPPEAERKIIRRFVTFLEDRGVLYNPEHLEREPLACSSVERIREQCTDVLSQLSEESAAVPNIRAMRAACRKFLHEPYPVGPGNVKIEGGPKWLFRQRRFMTDPNGYTIAVDFDDDRNQRTSQITGFFLALGEFRAVFGVQLALLATAYRLNIDKSLAQILPPADEES